MARAVNINLELYFFRDLASDYISSKSSIETRIQAIGAWLWIMCTNYSNDHVISDRMLIMWILFVTNQKLKHDTTYRSGYHWCNVRCNETCAGRQTVRYTWKYVKEIYSTIIIIIFIYLTWHDRQIMKYKNKFKTIFQRFLNTLQTRYTLFFAEMLNKEQP